MSRGRVQAPCCGKRRRRDERPDLQFAWIAVFAPLLLVLVSSQAAPASVVQHGGAKAAAALRAEAPNQAAMDLPLSLPGEEKPEISAAGLPALVCLVRSQDRRSLVLRSRSKRLGSDEDGHDDIGQGWRGWLWRSSRGWLLTALLLFVATGSARAADRPSRDFELGENRFESIFKPAAYTKRTRSAMQEGSPSSGAFDAPDVWRPYWESPNIVIEEADEYPHPRSLEVNDPDSFWYTNRPNILNVPIPDEWDFYNLINTDRPDFTDAVYSVGKGVTYLENGYTFHKIVDGPVHLSTRQLPESLLRHGLTDEFELRLKWNGYLMTDFRDTSQNVHLSQFGGQDLNAGFKWELIQQEGWRPMVSVVSGILIPTGTRGVSANAVEPHVNIVYGWGLRRWLYLKGQTGAEFLRVSNSPVSTISSVVPGFQIERSSQTSWHHSFCFLSQWTKRIGAFHEWFMIQNTGSGDTRAQNYMDMGLYLYMTPNVQFDARIGTRLSNRVNDTFTGAGFSARW